MTTVSPRALPGTSATDCLDHRRRHRAVRDRPLGQGLLLDRRRTATSSSIPTKDPARVDRPEAARRSPAAARHQPADPAPLPRHPASTASATSTTPSRAPSPQHEYQGTLQLRLPDQGEPAAAGRRGGARLRPAVRLRPRGRLASPSCSPSWRWPTTTRRSSATASRTTSSSRWRCWPRRSGRNIIPVVEKYTELRADPRVRREGRRAAEDRHARQAGGARRRPLAVVGRLPLEVRPDRRPRSCAASRS